MVELRSMGTHEVLRTADSGSNRDGPLPSPLPLAWERGSEAHMPVTQSFAWDDPPSPAPAGEGWGEGGGKSAAPQILSRTACIAFKTALFQKRSTAKPRIGPVVEHRSMSAQEALRTADPGSNRDGPLPGPLPLAWERGSATATTVEEGV